MRKALNPDIKSMSPLLVADLDIAISFYTQYLRFKVDFRYEDFYAGIIKDNFTIHFKLSYPSKEEQEKKIEKENLDLNISISEIEEFYEAIKNTSITIVQHLRQMPYGREFYITDPDGYLIGFVETG